MTTINRTEDHSDKIKTHIDVRQLDLKDSVLQIIDKPHTEFMIDSECCAAEDGFLDRRAFFCDAQQHQKFLKALHAPAQPSEALKALLYKKVPWEN